MEEIEELNSPGKYKGNRSLEPVRKEFLILSNSYIKLNLDSVLFNEIRKQETRCLF